MSVLQDQNDSTNQKNFFRNKAVSDGAISFYIDHFVRTRVSKFTYGVFGDTVYDPSAPDHRLRSHKVFTSVSGNERIGDFFDIILPKVSCLISFLQCMLLKAFICRIPKFQRRRNSENLFPRHQILYALFQALRFSVWCYRGNVVTPKWKDDDTSESHLKIICILDELKFCR